VPSADAPAQLLAMINRTLIRRAIQSRFVTVMYGVLDLEGRLTYSNAGHNPPVLIDRQGQIRRLTTGGLILGSFPQATYEEETIQLGDGDTLVIFSDGVTDAADPEGNDFGEARLLACIGEHRAVPPDVLLDRVLSAVRAYTAGAAQTDDLTALVLRYASRTIS
jgi:phosphoserine phosphatase RsbU/P